MATKIKKAIKNKLINDEHKIISLDNLQQFYDELVPLPIKNGGTGATTVAAARDALGLGNTSGAVPIANGGTGATSKSGAISNLGLTGTETRTLLWTNASPTSSFPAQTISLNLSNYSAVDIVVYSYETVRCRVGEITFLSWAYHENSSNSANYDRKIQVSTTGLTITKCYFSTHGGVGENTVALVPYRIYGIKEVS